MISELLETRKSSLLVGSKSKQNQHVPSMESSLVMTSDDIHDKEMNEIYQKTYRVVALLSGRTWTTFMILWISKVTIASEVMDRIVPSYGCGGL